MKKKSITERIESNVRNLDEILCGGIPKGSLTVFAGTPGAGKTILSQQIVFHNATPENPGLFFQTLSEPTAKTLKYISQFEFFHSKSLDDNSVKFVDLGSIIRAKGLEQSISLLMDHIKRVKPGFVVIDSFKVFEDLSHTREELRKFSYEVAIHLMAWEVTGFLLGEFNQHDIESNPIFSIVDGLIKLTVREESGEQQRFIQVAKMRGTDHSRDEHPFSITSEGIGIYAPRVTIRRSPSADQLRSPGETGRGRLGISGIDRLLGSGVPYGSSLLVSGVSGTGKTLLSLEFIYRGASEYGDKGLFVSFEETEERLKSHAKSMGWDLEGEIEKGKIEIVFIPQTDILVERDLLAIHERMVRLGPKRVAIDSTSLFIHKIKDPQIAREKIFQLATLIQKANAIGFFVTDVPYGANSISRFGVEETVVDGVIILSTVEKEFSRERYLEVYKLRDTAHSIGRHRIKIGKNGIELQFDGKRKSRKKKS
jgi:circadian clock protein KaiC